MKLLTIGFTKKSAETFFTKLKHSGAKRIVDVRLNNVSQLAGFAKRNDLQFFLREICHMDYVHVPELAPTQDILDEYKKNKGDWEVYEQKFLELMRAREIEKKIDPAVLADGEARVAAAAQRAHHVHVGDQGPVARPGAAGIVEAEDAQALLAEAAVVQLGRAERLPELRQRYARGQRGLRQRAARLQRHVHSRGELHLREQRVLPLRRRRAERHRGRDLRRREQRGR